MYPSFEETKAIIEQNEFKAIPFSKEILADLYSPIQVLGILKKASSHCFLLESLEDNRQWGRYSFLGYDPKMELTCENGRLTIDRKAEGQTITDKHAGSYPGDHPGTQSAPVSRDSLPLPEV